VEGKKSPRKTQQAAPQHKIRRKKKAQLATPHSARTQRKTFPQAAPQEKRLDAQTQENSGAFPELSTGASAASRSFWWGQSTQ